MIGRFVLGAVSGAGIAVCPLYNVEFSPKSLRGQLGSVFQTMLTLGIVTAFALSLPVIWLNQYWLIAVFGWPGVMGSIQLFTFLFKFRYEPFQWLIAKGSNDLAKESFAQICNEAQFENKFEKTLSQIPATQTGGATLSQLFCSQKYRKEMFIGCSASALQRLVGISAITFYSNQMFVENGQKDIAPYLTLLIGFMQLWPTLMTRYVIQKGRRPLFISSYAVLCIFHFLVGIFAQFDVSFIAQTICIIIWSMLYNLSVGSVNWVFLSEICSGEVMSIAVAINWISIGTIVATTGFMISELGIAITFYIFGTMCLIGFLFAVGFLFETKNHTKAELRITHFGYN